MGCGLRPNVGGGLRPGDSFGNWKASLGHAAGAGLLRSSIRILGSFHPGIRRHPALMIAALLLVLLVPTLLEAAYSYYYSDTLATINLSNWRQNGSVTGTSAGLTATSTNGGSLISLLAIPDGSSQYEVNTPRDPGGQWWHLHTVPGRQPRRHVRSCPGRQLLFGGTEEPHRQRGRHAGAQQAGKQHHHHPGLSQCLLPQRNAAALDLDRRPDP